MSAIVAGCLEKYGARLTPFDDAHPSARRSTDLDGAFHDPAPHGPDVDLFPHREVAHREFSHLSHRRTPPAKNTCGSWVNAGSNITCWIAITAHTARSILLNSPAFSIQTAPSRSLCG